MSRARHAKHHGHAHGGGATHPASTPTDVYAGAGSNVLKEAHERKRGGRVHHGEGHEPKHHAGKRARGGAVKARKHGGRAHHKEHEHEHERAAGGPVVGPKRARGGAVGADKRPLSSAANVKHLPETHGGGEGAGPANEQTEH